ncbi:cob(I)yrinic acid a,c-diamide adenosyltransferase [Nitrososphaera sp. AFS]|uniref:cob(I)yrinic acid a,c-diamide adenosyltransferase n=1 Tax=Nitrososphaera sp. AFS TaxID=2301191 RepID=UPI00351B9EFE
MLQAWRLKKGLVIVYTGKGKGKTTAALGAALRSVGHGHNVIMIQFIKGEWYYGELTSSKKLEPHFELIAAGKGFVGILDDDHTLEQHKEAASKAAKIAIEKLATNAYDLMILDEINYAANLDLIPLEMIIQIIKSKPIKTTLMLTGNYAPSEIIELADLVTEMREVKHPYKLGVKAVEGIDY